MKKNHKKIYNIIANVLAYLFLGIALALTFAFSSCSSSESIRESKTIKHDSIVKVADTFKTNKEVLTTKTIYKGLDEDFEVKADSLGNITEYKRQFNTGAVSGVIGYSKTRGNYYKISSKDVTEKDKTTTIDTIIKSQMEIKTSTWIDTVSNKVLVTKKWNKFNWITFIISLLVLIYIVVRIYKFISNPFKR